MCLPMHTKNLQIQESQVGRVKVSGVQFEIVHLRVRKLAAIHRECLTINGCLGWMSDDAIRVDYS